MIQIRNLHVRAKHVLLHDVNLSLCGSSIHLSRRSERKWKNTPA
ncbi:hypothetical protein OVA29_10535 [Exiguobacterium sp. SL14]|nr:hypothetical protein [Exiguobacterium sp. SL14]MCY1691054.1 hypothetical protein [Exiguobacterium sp. SL14]